MSLRVLALGLCAWGAQASAVTPVEKVIELLGRLQVQVTEEGKEEAAAYDKYACFCKQEVDDKLYATEKSTEKIAGLDARIDELSADIVALDGEIADLSKRMDKLDVDMHAAQETRSKEHAEFNADLADVNGAISACDRALEALKESKGALGGKSELESLAQIKAVARTMLGADVRGLDVALAARQPGKANQYTYHANDIIQTIETLRGKFIEKRNDVEQEEFDTNSAFEKRQLGLANERKFAEKDKLEREELADQKNQERAQSDRDRTEETNAMNADKKFMDVLVQECETKAQLWDQRSKSRADELRALSEAQTALKEGAAPNYETNKKLVGLQKASQVKPMLRGRWVYVEDKPAAAGKVKAVSFLQLRGSSSDAVAARAYEYLTQAAKELKSPLLSAAALKVSLSQDHFVKVRQIIKDLVARLQSEADAERTQKDMCDTEMKKSVESRDKSQSDVEGFQGEISAQQAALAELEQEIATLSKEIAENKKALLEATELRNTEHEENEKTVAEAGAGKEAVQQAIEVLKKFYQASFIQKKFVPTDSDREGKTVADKAPEVFDSEYQGNQEASKGIIGLLEVIMSDFERTDTTVKGEEAAAAQEFENFKTQNEADTKSKEDAKTSSEGAVTVAKDKLVELEESLKSAEEAHKLAVNELALLNSMCVAGEETHEERVAKREKEIEALKEAHDILENWQK